jgi:F-type H+-transporting ATPase subunit delta
MSVLSLRYAHALSSVVNAKKLDSGAVRQQLADFADTLADSRDLREVLVNPAISGAQKLKVVDAIAGRIGMLAQVRNFVAVVMDHDRLGEFGEIVAEFSVVSDASSGLTEAEITSAHILNDADKAELEAQIAKLVGSKIHATYREDKTLLGGAVVRIGSTVYDGSLLAQLKQLKQKLVNA